MGYDGSLKFDTRLDSSGFNSGIQKLGSIAKGGFAVLGTAVIGCIASFAALTKASLDSVASLEQNIGGVETLFKESADTVIANAKKAYTTAGMSANDYMATVTSFSASLLQSLGNNTKKAAEYADRAIVDMSDNANKMGTDMSLIQNAYQGFAKQNYTMLDNLKLGYGGTKTEMERLIKDAAELKDVQEKLGVTVDASSMSFGNIVNAISVMQESMGIAGTTAKEAATTIEGSMSSAKAALDNFLNGTGTVDELVDSFATAGNVIAENLGAIIPRLVETVPAAAEGICKGLVSAFEGQGLADVGKNLIENVVNGIYEKAPAVAETGLNILDSLVQGLVENAPLITEKAGELVSDLIAGIQENAPNMLTSGVELISSLVEGIAQQLPQLVPQALQMVVTLADAIISNIPTIASAGISLLKGLVQGIINSLPTLISEGPRIINDFADAIYSAVWELVKTGAELLVSLVQGLWESVPLLLENAGEILLAFINIFSLSKLFSLGKSLIQNLVEGVKKLGPNVVKTGGNIVEFLVNGIKNLATHPITTLKSIASNAMKAIKGLDWKSIGSNIIKGIVEGLNKGVSSIISAAKDVAGAALSAAKKALGIHSPSTVFRDIIGKNMALGMSKGFKDNIPVDDMGGSISKSIQRMQKKVSDITSAPATTVLGNAGLQQRQNSESLREQLKNLELRITNVFEVDSTPLVEKTIKKTIDQISNEQTARDRYRGRVVYE